MAAVTKFTYCVVFIGFCAVAKGAIMDVSFGKSTVNRGDMHSNYLTKCAENGGVVGILNCVAEKSIRTLRRAPQMDDYEILPGVTLFGDANVINRRSKVLKQEVQLPNDPKQRYYKLMDLLLDAALKFLSGRTLKVRFPENTSTIARAFEEGRGKMKKMMGPLMLGLGAKMMGVVPLVIGGLGVLASKALIVSKMALVLAVISFVQFFFSNRHSTGTPHSGYGGYGYGTHGSYGPPTWSTNQVGGQYPYARSIDGADDSNEGISPYPKSKLL